MGVPVVFAAQQPQVGRLGSATVGPVLDVMGVAPAGGDVTSGVSAALVSQVQGPAQGRRDDPAAVACFCRAAVCLVSGSGPQGEIRVAGQEPVSIGGATAENLLQAIDGLGIPIWSVPDGTGSGQGLPAAPVAPKPSFDRAATAIMRLLDPQPSAGDPR